MMTAMFSWFMSRVAILVYASEWLGVQRQLHHLRLELKSMKEFERPPHILQAMLVSGEDHRFYSHYGIDLIAVCRALWRTLACRRREGASTVEMQLVRVLTGHYEKSLSRKCKEVFLAILLSKSVPKAEIASLYLFVAYYGTGMEGFVRAICKLHIQQCVMTKRQAASLAARLKYPEPKSMSDRRRHQINSRTEYLMLRYAKYFDGKRSQRLIRQESYATISSPQHP
jgi:penicillin-binding protein 1A